MFNVLPGTTSQVAGKVSNSGVVDGIGTMATFTTPYGLALDTMGVLYVAEAQHGVIRMLTGKILFAFNISNTLY